MNNSLPSWAVPGTEVFVVAGGSFGTPNRYKTTILRVTKTQIVTNEDRRFVMNQHYGDPIELGSASSMRGSRLMPAGDNRLKQWQQRDDLRALVNETAAAHKAFMSKQSIKQARLAQTALQSFIDASVAVNGDDEDAEVY